MKDCIVIGYSGHAYVVIDALQLSGSKLAGYCENKEKASNPFNLVYLGNESAEILEDKNWIIGIGDNAVREKIYLKYSKIGRPCTVVHPSAIVSKKSEIGAGSFISARAVINPFAKLGAGAIVNTGAIIEHECEVGEFCHIAPGAILAGQVKVGRRSFVGANAVVKQQVYIGDDVIIGAGAVIINDVPDGATVVGNPGRIIKNKFSK